MLRDDVLLVALVDDGELLHARRRSRSVRPDRIHVVAELLFERVARLAGEAAVRAGPEEAILAQRVVPGEVEARDLGVVAVGRAEEADPAMLDVPHGVGGDAEAALQVYSRRRLDAARELRVEGR
jgi:hypothetical protein